ncbi:orotate phosphoribosyltransferase [cyanobacterium endosymbiont of Rhopalodia gibberula]|uniref:orotate phosphoribosyltransferase n=1 Tax=cyanobacterium endosymbiont of Rhopalodia gibberula TaxID=1763363 RepID=UPI000DC6D20A|nr:orotate phosphoribosyltransferase [cyanobacterium endosymbiont of Rhopalodia gibberula]BBA79901.1 orotate phosphoribosyltransferase [cyanobacterium endosymbiont of Rhopalodia gibberula]
MQSNSINTFCVKKADLSVLRQYLLKLFVDHAYAEGNFLLSSQQKSAYYINGKQVTLRAEGAVIIGRLLLSMLPEDTQGVAGLTLGADPIVTSVSTVSAYENRPIPALIVRKESKGHGTQSYIEGPTLEDGAKVVVLEDVVTTGKSVMLAVERLRAVGYKVDRVIALVDREQGGAFRCESQGLEFKAVFSITELQKVYQEKL